MKFFAFLLIAFALPSFSKTGIESLMGGVGQARLGSSGSLMTNPSLLAWHKQKKLFLSANDIRFYRFRDQQEANYSLAPEVIPKYAVTTEGLENWGYGYGLIVEKSKFSYKFKNTDMTSEGFNEDENISLVYGFGRKFDSFAFGLSMFMGRSSFENHLTFYGGSGNEEFLSTLVSRESLWQGGTVLGLSRKFDTWAWGISAQFYLLKFGAEAQNKTKMLHETIGRVDIQQDRKTTEKKNHPELRTGLVKVIDKTKIYFDVYYVPKHSAAQAEYGESISYGLGTETLLPGESYHLFSGIGFVPEQEIKNDDNNLESFLLNIGLSKKNKHSISFGGMSWGREVKYAYNEYLAITFGTIV